jgi:hypothetical protein
MVTINSRQKEKNIINKIIFTYLSYIKCNHKKRGGDKMEIKKRIRKIRLFRYRVPAAGVASTNQKDPR